MLLLVSSTHTHKLLAKANQQPKKLCGALWRSVALGLRVCEGLNYAPKKKISNKEKWKKFSSSHPILSYRRRIWQEIFRDENPNPFEFGKHYVWNPRTRLVCGSGLLIIIRVCDGSVWWTIPDGGMHSVWRTEGFGDGRLEDYSERRNGRPPEYLPSLIIKILVYVQVSHKWLIIKIITNFLIIINGGRRGF